MKILNIAGIATAFNNPKEFEFKELKPFNPGWVKILKLYKKQRGKNVYYLPRTYILPKTNNTTLSIPTYLRPKQKEAVKNLLQYNYGMLLSGVGSGKSFMMASIADMYDGHTLVIAPKKEIAKGLFEKFNELGIDAQIFDSKKFNINNPPKVLIMVQKSVNLYWEKLSLDKVYKQVLIDEIHMEFTKNRIHFFIHYKYDKIYGFTGTPELNNYSSEALFKIFNNVSVDSGIWPKDPVIYAYRHNGKYVADDWQDLVNTMYWDADRLSAFVAIVVEVMQKEDRHMGIVFVDRKDIADALAFAITKCGVEAKSYTGKLSSKKRQETLDHLTKTKGVMIATYQTVGTGFDHPPLDTAFYFMFIKFKAQVKQAVGRILRGAENPEYYDFQDSNLYGQVSSRIKAYKEMWPNGVVKKYTLKNVDLSLQCKLLYKQICEFKQNKEEDEDYLLF